MWSFFRRRRHARHKAAPFPAEWAAHLDAQAPHVRALTPAERATLEDLVQVFLAEKTFEGAHGLAVTDAMRVSVAAQACLLLLGDPDTAVYPELQTIVLYPTPYRARPRSQDGVFVTEHEQLRSGESWGHGVVVLAWSAVEGGAHDARDGQNVVFHEFAHQLDQAWGAADGAPELPADMCRRTWAETLAPEFARLEAAVAQGRRTWLDAYGATNPAEFFAVATEAFFERPRQMREHKPAIYRLFADFYRQDPAARLDDVSRR